MVAWRTVPRHLPSCASDLKSHKPVGTRATNSDLDALSAPLHADNRKNLLADEHLPVYSVEEPASDVPEAIGCIHSTESMSAVDGPGLRFMVFLQGCIARCQFCSNPDTWEFHAGHHVTSKKIASMMARSLAYMRASGGGLTCSGGEPLMQPHFVEALFREAHALGLNTVLDTNGQGCPGAHWDDVLPHTDLVLVCVKHLDANRYRELVGGSAKPASVLHFIEELNHKNIPFWIRYVLIPGHTMASEDIDLLVEFSKRQSSCLRGVELLPYHRLGVEKWRQLGIAYPMEHVEPPGREEVVAVAERLEAEGINVMCDVQTAAKARARDAPEAA